MKTLEFEYRDTLRAAIKKWGNQSQLNMLHEEIGELMQAINKFNRSPKEWKKRDNLCEEIADVEIMLEQLKLMIGGNPRATIHLHKREKLERLKERLES